MKKILVIMATLFSGAACAFPSDTITTASGRELRIEFFGHGSIAFVYSGQRIYIDPVSHFANYALLPKADFILVTHEHGDHLDPKAIETLSTPETRVIGNGTAIEALGHGEVLEHGDTVLWPKDPDMTYKAKVELIIAIRAFPAYNTSPDKQGFHPQAARHNGYILTFGGTHVYVAGDTEDTPELMALRDIDIAFLPVNQPYTMTEEQAAGAAKAIHPKIFYPYHYGRVERGTDIARLEKLLEGTGIEVRIRPLD